jgi:hypothetical protein
VLTLLQPICLETNLIGCLCHGGDHLPGRN